MKNIDQGLGAIGLMLLAIALTVLLSYGIPNWSGLQNLEAKDWLGFLGSIIGAAVALCAAVVAWRAVQRQVDAQREQMLLGVLMREEQKIEVEYVGLEGCVGFIYNVLMPTWVTGDPETFMENLRKEGIDADSDIAALLRDRFGAAPLMTLIEMTEKVRTALQAAALAIDMKDERFVRGLTAPGDDPEFVNVRRKSREWFNDERLNLLHFGDKLRNAIATNRTRLEKFRGRIERAVNSLD